MSLFSRATQSPKLPATEHSVGAGEITAIPEGVHHRFRNVSDTHEMKILWTYASMDADRTIIATGETRRIDDEHSVPAPPNSSGQIMMVFEVATFDVKSGSEEDFEAGVAKALTNLCASERLQIAPPRTFDREAFTLSADRRLEHC